MAHLGTSILGIVLIVVIPFTLGPEMPPVLLWQTMTATVLLALSVLEGFKAYSELNS